MADDLTLIPFEIKLYADQVTASTTFRIRRGSSELISILREVLYLKGKKVPMDFWTPLCNNDGRNGGESYRGNTQTDAYGEQLRSVKVERLLAFKDHFDVLENPWNKAIWAFLAELPPGTRVALFWQ